MTGCQHTQVHALQRVSVCVAAAAALVLLSSQASRAQQGLDPARQLYNQGRYQQAIDTATRLRSTPAMADAASLLVARSYLELFRKTTDRNALVAGRQALTETQPEKLTPRDRTDYLIGLGEALYLDDSFGPAAEIFATVLQREDDLGAKTFDRVLDWWATALDRQAQSGAAGNREQLYQAVRDQASAELARVPGSSAAAYWLAASYRYLGDLTRAWDAAVAAWVRAPLAGDQGRALRADIDQLVTQAILPERVRLLASTDSDRERVTSVLKASWEEVKRNWPNK
jgi:hypothetical protein